MSGQALLRFEDQTCWDVTYVVASIGVFFFFFAFIIKSQAVQGHGATLETSAVICPTAQSHLPTGFGILKALFVLYVTRRFAAVFIEMQHTPILSHMLFCSNRNVL